MSKLRLRIRRKLGNEKPSVWVGKRGSTPRIVEEVSRQLDQRGIVKVRVLKSALNMEEAKGMAAKIAQETAATLVEVRGHTFVLYKPRKGRKPKKSL